jgi:site-specific DNA-methyltransferase (adenine-specific)
MLRTAAEVVPSRGAGTASRPEARARPYAELVGPTGRPITLWHEDCVVGMRERLLAGSVDVVVTSPPYNRRIEYSAYRDDRPRAEYLAWIGRVTEGVQRVLAPRGSWFLNVGGSPSDPWLPWDVAREVGRRFELQNVFHWVKSIAIERAFAGASKPMLRGDVTVGHYKPIHSSRYVHGAHEYIFHFTRDGRVPLDRLAVGVAYQDKSNVGRWRGSGRDVRCRGNTWFLPYTTIRERARDRPHPASYPPELAERCLRLHGVGRARRVLDPFVGIGSSAIAAGRLGEAFVGFDIDEAYLRVASGRLRQEFGSRPRRPVARATSRSARRPTGGPRAK